MSKNQSNQVALVNIDNNNNKYGNGEWRVCMRAHSQ